MLRKLANNASNANTVYTDRLTEYMLNGVQSQTGNKGPLPPIGGPVQNCEQGPLPPIAAATVNDTVRTEH